MELKVHGSGGGGGIIDRNGRLLHACMSQEDTILYRIRTFLIVWGFDQMTPRHARLYP